MIHPPKKTKRKPTPDPLPRVEVELVPGGAECAQCGGKLRRLGEDVTEELEYVRGHFIVNRIVRPKRACTSCDCFTQAPLPSRPVERGRPGPGLLAHVLVNKYADHLSKYSGWMQGDVDAERHGSCTLVCTFAAILDELVTIEVPDLLFPEVALQRRECRRPGSRRGGFPTAHISAI
jgi:transposase